MKAARRLGLALGVAGLLLRSAAAVPAPGDATTVIVVVGVAGDEAYAPVFAGEVAGWTQAARRGHAACLVIGQEPAGAASDRDRLRQALAVEAKDGPGRLWLVLIGHGTFDGREAKFNLRGPDVSASELALWLQPFHRPLAVIDTSSSSAPFLNKLSAPGRVVITATRSGEEHNYARFGQYLAEAIGDPQSDLDRDGEVSLLEAFLAASGRLAEFYQTEGRLATEHPLLDDNGDGLGTPPDWFQGVHAIKRARDGASVDGPLARQFVLVPGPAEQALPPDVRARRDQLELAVARLREQKPTLKEDDYYARLEALLLPLARLYPPPAPVPSR
jgi:hypothetical protein